MSWTVHLTRKVQKQRELLPKKIQSIFDYLLRQMELDGPIQKKWTHFGDLCGMKDVYHCHIKSGKPTYVVVWMVSKKEKYIEVTYVGTHEKAPY